MDGQTRRHARSRIPLFLGVGLVTTLLALGAYAADLLRPLELSSVDARFAVRGTQPPPPELLVVEIDDVTFDDLRTQWPFPRSWHGRVIDRIARGGARAIVYDVQFTEPSEPAEDNALIEAVDRAGNVVLATTEVDEEGGSNVLGGEELLAEIGARAGNALLPNDAGGVIRRVPYAVDGLESLAVVAAETASGRQIERSDLGGDTVWIDYTGPPDTIPSLSFSRVLDGRAPPGVFRDKIVVVGPSAATFQDLHPTSTSGGEVMSGVEIQANAISTALRGFRLRGPSTPLTLVLLAVLGMVAPATSLRWPALRSLAIALAVAVAYVVAAQAAFERGVVLSFVYPVGALAVSAVGALAVHYLLEAFERQRTRGLFSRFVPEAVVDQVLAQADGGRLGGVHSYGTAMFTDVRGFTTFSEPLPAEQVIDILNHYLAEMTEAILSHGGTVVSYAGDGIFAVFGAPIEQADHADRALETAREMLSERLPRFNRWLREQGFAEEVRMGIGLNSGAFMSGNVGSEQRLEYTAIGDTINTASRLEGMTKGTPNALLLADSTRLALTRDPGDLVYVGEFEVRGRRATIKLWSLAEPGMARPAAHPEAAPVAR